jgi:HlyD family secretion protein
MTQQFISKPSTQKLLGLVITATALTGAIATLKQAQTNLEQAYIRAPFTG